MRDLTISLVQQPLAWLDRSANLSHFTDVITPLKGQTDLIILPEMFTTGFSMAPEPIAETFPGPTLEWLEEQARTCGAAIIGSFAVQSDNAYFNRLVFMQPDGRFDYYDKRHLFRMGNEHHHYSSGSTRLVVDYLGWRICPMVCYDLRFPVWSRNCDDFDLLLYIANWPSSRRQHWLALLQARAIENLCYVAGVNRVGEDGNGLHYSGDSSLFDAWGETQIAPQSQPGCFTHTLSYAALSRCRETFPAHLDADQFSLL